MGGIMKCSSKAAGLQSLANEREGFSEIVQLIVSAREKVIRSVNSGLIELYWEIGLAISRKIEAAEWGDAVVE
jgi:hypothetical protein